MLIEVQAILLAKFVIPGLTGKLLRNIALLTQYFVKFAVLFISG